MRQLLTCGCPLYSTGCTNQATQEDYLCDVCRGKCILLSLNRVVVGHVAQGSWSPILTNGA